ncbi:MULTISPECIES: ABC transporter permease subunit [unclassified Mesorhizobium]|uniref:ABC transporter permease n=1 Tax=unclassified Mesorhizobium TaxID=325217 RepID=UPI001093E5F8|nr:MULTISPECIES: ABC transporter permease subunit [unclassified Mesorhizobium]TGT91320.1 ABC transporter permease subunit [Mesorhizobium sp. M8A.F.Ca.ET.161.01.1.1]TGV43402.1 ABC transporter permease subunit [Mesorhizobium sp. M8A.F.Ca.ET.142.01.1.1]
MDPVFIGATFLKLLAGIPLALELAAGSIALGALIGMAIALLRLSGVRALVFLAWLYVLVIRSVPLLVLLFLFYYGLGQFRSVRASVFWPFLREPFCCALLALTINTSAYAAEIIRGGLLSVSEGEKEAARACGMSRLLMFRRIVLPLAIRQALPAYSNEMIAMVKATSIASLVTLMEISGIATTIAAETYRPIEVYTAAGIIYLGMTLILTRAVTLLEHWLNPQRRPATPAAEAREGIS